MSLKKIIGQLIITDISSADTERYSHEYEKLIKDYNVGGIMLFNDLNLKDFPIKIENQLIDKEQTEGLIRKLKSYNSDLFIAVDVEGGLVDRLYHVRKVRYPSAKEIGEFMKKGKEGLTYAYFHNQGKYLGRLGFNMNAAPVLDVVPSYKEKYLMAYHERGFSPDPKIVSQAGLACIKGLQNAKIIPVAKHFPGLGPVLKGFDPHVDFPKIKKVTKKSLKPFFDAVDKGIEVIMTTHLQVEEYGAKVATVNKDIVNVLRGYGFNGIVVTDDICFMSTGMLNRNRELGPTKENIQSIVDTAYGAIKAGHDMVLVRQLGCVNNPDTDFIGMIIDRVVEGLKKRDISPDRILRSYARVLDLKEKYL